MPAPEDTAPTFLNKTALKARGWTEATIRELLGKHDEVRTIRIPRIGMGDEYLYASARVIAAETSDAFAEVRARSEKRKASAARAVATKEQKLMAWVSSLQIEVPRFEAKELVNLARSSVLRLYNRVPDNEACTAVNFLRHEMTDYDRLLDSTFGMTGTGEAKLAVREKVLDAIAAAYPEFQGECDRQLDLATKNFWSAFGHK